MTVPENGQPGRGFVTAEEDAACRRVVSQFPTTSMMLVRRDGTSVASWVGEGIARISGYEVEELEADPGLWNSIVHPGDRDKVHKTWRRLTESRHAHTEYRIFRKDGQMRWVADTGAAESTEEELVLSIRCAADITAAKSGRTCSIDFEDLVNQTPVAITVRDLTGRMLYCNQATAKLYGFASAQDMIDTTPEDAMSPEFAAEFRECILPKVLSGPWSGEAELVTLRGDLRSVGISSNLFRDGDGSPVAFYVVLTDISRLKETESALRAKEELARAVQDALPANLAVIDGEGNVITVSERWRQFARENGDPELTHTCEGTNYLDVCRRARGAYSDGASEVLEGLTAILAGERDEFEIEYPCPSPDQQRWFFVRAAPLANGLTGAVVAHIDITKRKRAEAALRESEERYHSLLENLDAVVFRIDKDMNPIALAGHIERVVGYSVDEILRHPSLFREMVHPEDIHEARDLLDRTLALRSPLHLHFRVRHRTGETRWLRGTLTPIFSESGDLLFYDGVSLDVTQLMAAEEARRTSEERYRSVVDTADALIFRVDSAIRPIAVFGRVADISGYTMAEVLEDPDLWGRCVHPDDIERVGTAYQEIAATGERRPLELRIVGKSGATRWMRSQITPRYDTKGDFLYFDGVALDITERIETQQRESRRAAMMAALTDMSQQFASSLDAQTILDVAARRLRDTLDSTSVGITIEPRSGHLLQLSIACPGDRATEGMYGAVRRSGLTIEDVLGRERPAARFVADLRGMSSVAAGLVDAAPLAEAQCLGPAIVAPVSAGANASGALFSARAVGQDFDSEDLWFLSEVASHASAALTNAALYRRQAHIAEELQRNLIPTAPSVECLDIATLYAPAPGEAEVGGDFLDVFDSDGGRVGIVVGDVSGKGLGAAIHTAEAKYMLRAFAHENPDPQHVITLLNEALCKHLPDETFVTLVYALIDAKEHTMTCASAGHETPMILCRDGHTIRTIGPTGPALGLTSDAIYTVRGEILEPDDLLLCYTDGITDVRVNGGRFGHERLEQTILSSPPGDAQSLMNHVLAKVRSFGPIMQTDDQVVVVVRTLI